MRRFPGRSAMAIVVSSIWRIRPGGSPLGLASAWPSASVDTSTTNGASARNAATAGTAASSDGSGVPCAVHSSDRMIALAQCRSASSTVERGDVVADAESTVDPQRLAVARHQRDEAGGGAVDHVLA